MIKIPFIKMDGLGNDFMIIDGRTQPVNLTAAQIAKFGNRKTGVGFDQLFIITTTQNADAKMLIYNADGSPAGACGNGTRCIAKLLFSQGAKAPLKLEAPDGKILTAYEGDLITVDMGRPALDWQNIPLSKDCDTLKLPLSIDGLKEPVAVSMGNPHAVFFVDDIASVDPAVTGPKVESDKLFPQKTNVEFAQVLADDKIRMRVWERGAGITMACGSGACATLVAAARRALIKGNKAQIIMDGGILTIEWRAEDKHVLMTGPTNMAFEGAAYL